MSAPETRSRLHAKLEKREKKGASHERIAREVAKKPELLDELVRGLSADSAPVKFGSGKVLRIVAQTQPEVLYPKFRVFADLLDSDNKVMQWEGIKVIAELAAVDGRGKVTRLLDRYLAPIRGPVLITAANAIKGAGRIASAKPRLADRIGVALLGVSRARFETPECKNIAVGKAIEALAACYEHLTDKAAARRFVRRQLRNPRPATRKKAERFCAEHG